MRPPFPSTMAAFLFTTLLGVFCATGVTESEVESEVSIELEEVLVYRRDVVVEKSVRQTRPLVPQSSSEPAFLNVPLTFRSERTDLNGFGAPLRT